jgi:hypothetical protein
MQPIRGEDEYLHVRTFCSKDSMLCAKLSTLRILSLNFFYSTLSEFHHHVDRPLVARQHALPREAYDRNVFGWSSNQFYILPGRTENV